MEKSTKLIKNVALITIGGFASKLMSFLFMPFYTTMLTPEEYGIADLVITTVLLLSPIFTGMICESTMRFALDADKDKTQVLSISMYVNLFGLALTCIIMPIAIQYSATLSPFIFYLLLYYMSYSLFMTISYFIQGMQLVTLSAVGGIIYTATAITSNLIFLLWLKIGLEGYLLSFIISGSVSSIFLIYKASLWHYICRFSKLDKVLIKNMFRYSLPMIPNSLSWWVSNFASRYILTSFTSVYLVGIFAAANKIPSIIYILSGFFVSAWRLSVVDNWETPQGIEFCSQVYDKYFSFCILSSSLLVVVNKIIAYIFLGQEFYSAWQYMPILIIAVMFHGLCEFFGTIYTTAKKTHMLLYSSLLGAVVQIVCGWILVAKFSIWGAALSMLLSYFVTFLFRMIHSSTIIKLRVNIKKQCLQLIILIVQVYVASITVVYARYLSIVIYISLIFMNIIFIQNVWAMVMKTLKRRSL